MLYYVFSVAQVVCLYAEMDFMALGVAQSYGKIE